MKKRVSVVCSSCKKTFEVYPSVVAQNIRRGCKHICCSVLCKGRVWSRKDPKVLFWEKVDKSGNCWIWQGSVNKEGYGGVQVKGMTWSTHRYSWFIEYGEIPKGLCVLHKCDNPSCVRPDHLFLGTQKDNVIDCYNKGRGRWQRIGDRPCQS